jgi:LuxR family maltose regulon positive regulatory protein
VLWERNELERAEEVLRQGIEQSGQVGAHFEHHLDGLLSLALLRQAHGDPDGATASLELAEQRGGASPFAARVALTRAKLWWARGDVEAAAGWAAEREGALGLDDELRGEHIADYLMIARVSIGRQRVGGALCLLERVLPLAEAGGYGRAVLEAHVLQALAQRGQGEQRGALEALGRARALAEPEAFVRVFLDEGAPMAALLREALERGVRPGYAATLLAAFGEDAPPVPGGARRAQPLADPLSERELEVLRLVAAGLSNAAIAERLIITEGTVKNHLKSIYGKLGAHSRVQAVERARALGLL